MNSSDLTVPCGGATFLPNFGERGMGSNLGKVGMAILAVAMLQGCINVSAPDKPIVIELNINIQQEVVYRLAADAGDTIEENADIF